MINNQIKISKGERGQGFMELAVSLVFLLILLSVVIELGWAFYEMTALRDTVQEAAAFASICPPLSSDDTSVDPPTGNTGRILERLQLSATEPLTTEDIQASEVKIETIDKNTQQPIIPPNPPVLGNGVRITIVYGHQIKAPFVGAFFGSQNYDLTVTVTNTILRKICVRDD